MANLEDIRLKILIGDRKGALADVVDVLRVEPHNVDAWMMAADLLDEPQRKRECYRRVLAENPDHQAARRGLAALEPVKEQALPVEQTPVKEKVLPIEQAPVKEQTFAKEIASLRQDISAQEQAPVRQERPAKKQAQAKERGGTKKNTFVRRALLIASITGGGLLLILVGWWIFNGLANRAAGPAVPSGNPSTVGEINETPAPAQVATRGPLQTQTLGALTITREPVVVAPELVTYYFAQNSALYCRKGATDTKIHTFELDIRQAAYSPDGNLTALTADQALWLVNCTEARLDPIAETWQIRPMDEEPAFEGSRYYPRYLAWSPDSRFIYFDTIRTSDLGNAVTDDLFRIELDTNAVTQILPAGLGGQPQVSPDGSRIATAGQQGITLANADGSQALQVLTYSEQPLTQWEMDAPPLVWLLDNSAFLTVISMEEQLSEKYGKEYTLFRVSAADGTVQELGRFSIQDGALYLSPDGRYMIYQEYEGEDAPLFAKLHFVPLDGSEQSWVAGGENAQFVDWLPDTNGYLYVLDSDRQMYTSYYGGPPDQPAVEDAFPQPFLDLEWLSDQDFVVMTGLGFYSGKVGGGLKVLMAEDPGSSRLLAAGLK